MATNAITIQVDPETAEAYRSASPDEREKIDTLLALKLREAVRSQVSLQHLMDEIGREAQARGLTPATLNSILNEA